jgi:PAS domain S-box-containing protein
MPTNGIALIENTVEASRSWTTSTLIECNSRFCELLGYTLDELRRLKPWDWDIHATPENVQARHAQSRGTNVTFETRHRRKDGSTYDAEVSVQSASIGGRKVFVAVVRDASARVKAREDLKAREEIFRSIVSQAADAIVLIDPADGSFVELTRRLFTSSVVARAVRCAHAARPIDRPAARSPGRRGRPAADAGGSDLEVRHRHHDSARRARQQSCCGCRDAR